MADNPEIRAGTAGGTVTVAADEVTIYGGAAVLQGVKIHDGTEAGTVGAKVSTGGALHTHQTNSGTVSVSNTTLAVWGSNTGTVTLGGVSTGDALEVWPNSAGTVQVSNVVPVWVNGEGTVDISSGGTLLGQAGTVTIGGVQTGDALEVWTSNAGTVTLGAIATGDALEVWTSNAGTVTIGAVSTGDALEVWPNTKGTVDISSGGTLLGQAGTVTIGGVATGDALEVWTNNAGTVAAWVNTAGTVTANSGTLLGQAGTLAMVQAGTVSAWVNTAGTVSVSNTVTVTANSGTLLGQAGTVTIGGVNTGDALEVWTNNAGTVAAWVNTAGTVTANSGTLLGQAGTVAVQKMLTPNGDSMIDDTNDALQVNVVAGGAGDGAILDGVSSSIKATVLDYTNSNPLAVRLTDTGGDYVAAGAGTQYTEDAAAAANPVGSMLIGRRKDTLSATEVSDDGDNIALNATSKGELHVKHADAVAAWVNTAGTVSVSNTVTVTANSGTLLGQAGTVTIGGVATGDALEVWVNTAGTVTANGGTLLGQAGTVNVANAVPVWVNTAGTVAALPGGITGYAEDAGHNSGDIGIPALTWRKGDATASSGAENDYQLLTTDTAGALWTHVNAGTVTVGNTIAAWTSNAGTVAAWANTAGTVAALPGGLTGYAEDAGHTTGDIGVMPLAVRKGDAAALAGAENDYAPLEVDAVGALWAHINAGTVVASAGTNLNTSALALESGGNLAAAATSLAILDDWDNGASDGASVSGDVAHDSPDAGEPVKVGHKAIAHGANPTAVAANDRTNWYANLHGIPWVIGGHPNIVSREYMATSAQTDDPIVSVSAGAKIVVTAIEAMVDNATSVDVGVRVGFGTANVPSEPADGATVDGVVLSHPGIAPGSGVVRGSGAGILAVGGDDQDLRITCEAATDGKLRVLVTYYTIES